MGYFCSKFFSISGTQNILASPIEYLKGVGPQRGEMIRKELSIHTFRDLLEYYPFRHVDRTRVNLIREITPNTDYIQVAGKIMSVNVIGEKRAKRLVAEIRDQSGTMELIWFQGINYMEKAVTVGSGFRVFGKVSFFNGQAQMTHPEIESLQEVGKETKSYLEPVYNTTEKLKARGLGGRQIGKLTQTLVAQLREKDLPENLPDSVLKQGQFVSRFQAIQHIHFPPSAEAWQAAMNRLKFEEFFVAQLRLSLIKSQRHRYSRGVVFSQVGELFNNFYENHLPFELTGAQKRVVKEIRKDAGTGRQMNRLLQGDVGSGKT
ncbi:MAG TPA: OB-fold nucleic acid binding domain-containing protein, partial [Pseudobacter sp.]|nr:OB-fold nucleic acid binding domain-containing protein [Pseudobacter sp.]